VALITARSVADDLTRLRRRWVERASARKPPPLHPVRCRMRRVTQRYRCVS